MREKLSLIIEKTASKEGIKKSEFIKQCMECSLIVSEDEFELAVEYISHCGIKLIELNGFIFSESRFLNYKDAVFCIVDIETSGNSVDNSQIIEIGAIKYKNFDIIDRFESFVYCDYVPEYIERITNISKEDLKDAPTLKVVLSEFKNFLSDSVFVAHNVRFDYNFIADSFKKFALPELLNRRLCTIDLAKRTIESEKYGLSFLKEKLSIDIENHHRAYADALSALKIFEISLQNISEDVKSVEDLISFSKPCKSKKKKRGNRT